ncbi:MAG: adenine phosphoribosyltransferase [Alphaproteobacteria bacterium]|nr:adenine phosphoribosyltransferase [Alphaproteobacteria bacterium]
MKNKLINNIRIVKDFPKKGINFYDISSLLANPALFNKAVNQMSYKVKKMKPTAIAAIDSRGFIFASIIAYKLKIKLIMIRKKGKLPGKIYKEKYKLEYGTNDLEIQKDFLSSTDNVIVVDDILATGGTFNAAFKLISKNNAKILGSISLLELVFLDGRKKLKYEHQSLLSVNT